MTGSGGSAGEDDFRSWDVDDGVVFAAGDAERRDEYVHQHDEVEQVGGGVLPASDAAERRPLSTVFSLLLRVERATLKSLGQALFGLQLVLVSPSGSQLVAGSTQFLFQLGVPGRPSQGVLHHAGVVGRPDNADFGRGQLDPRRLDARVAGALRLVAGAGASSRGPVVIQLALLLERSVPVTRPASGAAGRGRLDAQVVAVTLRRRGSRGGPRQTTATTAAQQTVAESATASSPETAVAAATQDVHAASALVVVEVTDVDDYDSDAQLEHDTGDQQGQNEVVEPVAQSADVEQQLEFGDLCQREDRQESGLCLGLRLFQLAVTRQQLHTQTHIRASNGVAAMAAISETVRDS